MTPQAIDDTLARVPNFPVDRAAGVAGMAAFVVMAGTQIAIPLADERTVLTSLVIVAFAAASLAFAVDAWGPARACGAATFVACATFALERVGSTTGFPFGEYEYTAALEPHVGGVPLIVPLAWFAMGVPALDVGRRLTHHRAARIAFAALALTAWDLFLDPQMVDEGYWEWSVDGAYVGIPISNYLGWLGSAVIVLGVVDLIASPVARPHLPHLALYTWWAVMNTVGLIVFFGLPVAGLVGGVAMGTITALTWRATARTVATSRSTPT